MVQEVEDVFRGNFIDGTITKFFDIPLNDCPRIAPYFFSNRSCGNRSRFWLFLKVSSKQKDKKEDICD